MQGDPAQGEQLGRRRLSDRARRPVDIAIAGLLLLALAPAILLIAAAILLESGRPVLFAQVRLGHHGRPFHMLKFRKFRTTESRNGLPLTRVGDARMTRVGRILYATKMDELPQLWNVLRGEMAMVGPRPESLAFADCFQGWLARVLDHKPGILGPSQAAFRDESALFTNEADPTTVYREVIFSAKAAIDLAYYPSGTLWRDLFWIGLGGPGDPSLRPGLRRPAVSCMRRSRNVAADLRGRTACFGETGRSPAMTGAARFPAAAAAPRRWATILLMVLVPLAARAEYRVGAGDSIEIRVAGLPDFAQRALVQQDGTVSLTGLGDVRVGGLSVVDMRDKIIAMLASRVFRQRTPDGQQHVVALQPGDISVGIAEYRPIYVNGDVLNPGQQPFRPALTIRQAVALAGGYSILHNRLLGSGDLLELQGQIASVAGQLTKEHVHAARLQAELAGKTEIGPLSPGDAPLSADVTTQLLQAEGESLKLSQAVHDREKEFLVNAIEHAAEQVASLRAEQVQEEQGLQSDKEDLERSTRLYGNGSLPSPRVAESRRAMLAASTRRMQTTQNLIQIGTQRDELILRLQKLISDRRLSLLEGLKASGIQLGELNTRLANLRERSELLVGSQGTARSKLELNAEIAVVRQVGSAWTTIAAPADAELQPGDVLTIRVNTSPDLLHGASSPAY